MGWPDGRPAGALSCVTANLETVAQGERLNRGGGEVHGKGVTPHPASSLLTITRWAVVACPDVVGRSRYDMESRYRARDHPTNGWGIVNLEDIAPDQGVIATLAQIIPVFLLATSLESLTASKSRHMRPSERSFNRHAWFRSSVQLLLVLAEINLVSFLVVASGERKEFAEQSAFGGVVIILAVLSIAAGLAYVSMVGNQRVADEEMSYIDEEEMSHILGRREAARQRNERRVRIRRARVRHWP